jgi:predicted DNA-binding WGR domain protein
MINTFERIKMDNKITKQNVNHGNIQKIYLENKEDNHYKFYIILRSKDKDNEWVAQWGRIGNKPQQKLYEYFKVTPFDQLQAKLKKNYKISQINVFDEPKSSTDEALEYLKSIGIDIDSLDDLLI